MAQYWTDWTSWSIDYRPETSVLVLYELQKSLFAPFYQLMRPMRLLILELYEFSVIAAGDVYSLRFDWGLVLDGVAASGR